MSQDRLTGRTRYRTERRWFKPDVLVLQVEVTYGDGPSDHNGLPAYLAGTGWRDALPQDLTVARCVPQVFDSPPSSN